MPRAASARSTSANLPLASRSTFAVSTVSGRRSSTARTACSPYSCWRRLATPAAAACAARLRRLLVVLDWNEIDFSLFDVHGDEPDLESLGEAILSARALALQHGAGRILVIIVARQCGHVDEAIGLNLRQPHEQPER